MEDKDIRLCLDLICKDLGRLARDVESLSLFLKLKGKAHTSCEGCKSENKQDTFCISCKNDNYRYYMEDE